MVRITAPRMSRRTIGSRPDDGSSSTSNSGRCASAMSRPARALIALAHRPELLVLDEPSSGLDPIVRRDILGAVMRTIADEGRTVLFSSHLLDEVEEVADHVTMIASGRIVLSAPLADLKESHRAGGCVPSLHEIFVARVGAAASPGPDPQIIPSPALAIRSEIRRPP